MAALEYFLPLTDNYNKEIIKFLKNKKYNFISTWPVITEVMHMLNFNVNVQIDFLKRPLPYQSLYLLSLQINQWVFA